MPRARSSVWTRSPSSSMPKYGPVCRLPLAAPLDTITNNEYDRGGSANLFVTVEPLASWRHIEPTERRTQRE